MPDDLYAHGIELSDVTVMEPGETEVTMTDAARENWYRMALQWLRVMVARGTLSRFTAAEASRLAYQHDLPAPPDVRSWGNVLQRAKDEGIIRQFTVLGGVPITALSPARHQTPVWVGA